MIRRLFFLTVVLIGVGSFVGPARANVINVTTTADQFSGVVGSGCSLRDAFNGAVYGGSLGDCEMSGADDTIKLPAGTYTLSVGPSGDGTPNSGDLDFAGTDPVTIEPRDPGDKVVIAGGLLDRIFDHVGAGVGDLILRNLTLTGGLVAPGSGQNGGAIRNASGLVRLEGVTVYGNTSGEDGGGVWVGNGASLEAINSTFSQNRAPQDGGAISLENLGAFADLRSVTITENRADDDADGLGNGGGLDGGIGNSTVMMLNSILAGNQDGSPLPADRVDDCISNSNFLPRFVLASQQIGTGECFATLPSPESNLSPADAGLEGFGDNGGPTPTYSPAPGSPARMAGGNAFPDLCPAVDQRGVERPEGRCDLGAVQVTGPAPVPLPGRSDPTPVIATFDGADLVIRLKCPARFKPSCRSVAVALTNRRGTSMTSVARVKTRANRWRTVRLRVKAPYRARVEAMTFVDRRQLLVRQRIRSKRIGARKAPRRPSTVFHTYKVRVRT